MDGLVRRVEKVRPFFKKVMINQYLRTIRDSFIALMPIIIFSSSFLLIANMPQIWGFVWPKKVAAVLSLFYNLSMGFLSLATVSTVAKALTGSLDLELPKTGQIPVAGVQYAAQIPFTSVIADTLLNKGNLYLVTGMIGTKGLIHASLVAFIIPNIYYFCLKYNVAITLPGIVPQDVARAFKNIIPLALATTFFWTFTLIFRALTSMNLVARIVKSLTPLFTAAGGYAGLAAIYGIMAFFWFIGIQRPSTVEPAVTAMYLTNIEANLGTFNSGSIQGVNRILLQGVQMFVATSGGTGAALVVALMFVFLSRSKRLKAVRRTSTTPVIFGVNEPILFGVPLILDSIFFIPSIFVPILNVWIFRVFVDMLHMPSFIYNLPWTTLPTLGLQMGTGFNILALLLGILLLAVDSLLYYPLFKACDASMLVQEEEKEELEEKDDKKSVATSAEPRFNGSEIPPGKTKDQQMLNVLVLCTGGETSGILAKSLNKLAKEDKLPSNAATTAFGSHHDLISGIDVVILAL